MWKKTPKTFHPMGLCSAIEPECRKVMPHTYAHEVSETYVCQARITKSITNLCVCVCVCVCMCVCVTSPQMWRGELFWNGIGTDRQGGMPREPVYRPLSLEFYKKWRCIWSWDENERFTIVIQHLHWCFCFCVHFVKCSFTNKIISFFCSHEHHLLVGSILLYEAGSDL